MIGFHMAYHGKKRCAHLSLHLHDRVPYGSPRQKTLRTAFPPSSLPSFLRWTDGAVVVREAVFMVYRPRAFSGGATAAM